MKLSLVSISLNSRHGLLQTVQSALEQTRPPDEYVIQDGRSSDQSIPALIACLKERYRAGNSVPVEPQEGLTAPFAIQVRLAKQECQIRIQSEPDKGIYDALNRAVSCAKGDVIGLLHADDVYANSYILEHVMREFEAGAEAVYGDLQYVRSSCGAMKVLRHWRSGAYDPDQLKWGWMPPHPTLFLKREVYERSACSDGCYFDPIFRCAGDYDFILRALPLVKVPPIYIPEVFVQMQVGGISNRNVGSILRKSREDWWAIRRNQAGSVLTLMAKNVRKVGQFCVRS